MKENKQDKDKAKDILNNIKKKFNSINLEKLSIHLMVIAGVLWLFNLLFNYLEILPYYLNVKFFFVLFIASGVFYFVQIIKKIPEAVRDKSSMVYYFSHFFLLSLIVIAVNQFLKRQIIIDNLFYISVLSIGFGFLTFYANRDRVEKEIEDEKEKEGEAEKKREEEFEGKFPRINKIWGLRSVVRWMYREGWWYVIILLAILIIFTAIKVPYFDLNFTGEHTMKYNSYVEPAKYMAEQNNPFWNQKKYFSDPINNPKGISNSFGHIPIMEWGLLSTYKLFPNNSLEFNTRLFTNFIGLLILISAYIFFKFYFSKMQSLIILFLMAINPIISFATFVTILDSFLILFMFLSLIFLNKYIKDDNIKFLFLAGLFFGIGNSIKYSLFLWLAPISFLLIFFNRKSIALFFKDYGIYILLAILPILTIKTSIKYLPSNLLFGLSLFLCWIIFYSILFYSLKKYNDKLKSLVKNILKYKLILISSFLLILVLGLIFLKFTNILSLSNEFLTDLKLILNYDMYKHMLLEQFKIYMTPNLFFIGLIGLGCLLFVKNKNIQKISISFLIGSLIYWILASKVIFFHNYYTLIIMILFCILSSIIFMMFKAKNKFYGIVVIFLFLLIVFPSSHKSNIDELSKEKEGFLEASMYLENHTNIDELYIDEKYLLSLTIKTNRSRVGELYFLERPKFKEDIKNMGFRDTMHKNNIKYLITTAKEPKYEKFVNLFTNEELQSTSYRRSDIILSKLDENYDYFSDIDKRKELVDKYDIKNKFKLEKQIGVYRFFTFQN